MLDLRSVFVRSLEQHDIEPADPIGQMVPSQILGRQADQLFLLLPVYGMDRTSEILRPSRLHLDEYQHRSVFDNEIQFTCLLYTSDAADERSSVDLGGRRMI